MHPSSGFTFPKVNRLASRLHNPNRRCNHHSVKEGRGIEPSRHHQTLLCRASRVGPGCLVLVSSRLIPAIWISFDILWIIYLNILSKQNKIRSLHLIYKKDPYRRRTDMFPAVSAGGASGIGWGSQRHRYLLTNYINGSYVSYSFE